MLKFLKKFFHTCEFELLKSETIPVNYDNDYLIIDMELWKCKHCDSYSQEEVSRPYEKELS